MTAHYDHVVVGSGVSGMTMALLLGKLGKRVLLLEKARAMGGSLRRFRCAGLPYDVGFHFAGGLHPQGMLTDILNVLGIGHLIKPYFLDVEQGCSFVIQDVAYRFPLGRDRIVAQLSDYFPQERLAIERYFQQVDEVCNQTQNMDLRHFEAVGRSQPTDFVSLQTVLDKLTDKAELKALLSGYCMCYGTQPREISFANHARICRDFYTSVARVEGGGDAFVQAFAQAFADVPVEVQCGTTVQECLDIQGMEVRRLLLSSGQEVTFDSGILAIHPRQIMELLPKDKLRKAWIHRVEDFEPSCSFFSIFGTRTGRVEDTADTITGVFSSADMNAMLDPACPDEKAILLLRTTEAVNGKSEQVFTALEPTFVEDTQLWALSQTGHRDAAYYDYKERKAAHIDACLQNHFSRDGETFHRKASASMLTYRDYLHSPDGSAYGIKQKTGQFNLFGKLPLRNLYAIGQSSLLPGIVGAMMSAFIVARSIEDRDKINELISKKLSA